MKIQIKKLILNIAGSVILAFGLYNIHALSGVTEGGILGLTLFFKHWFDLSPAVTGLIMNVICYSLGYKLLGKEFIVYSAVAGLSFSAFYAFAEQFEPLWPSLAGMPFAAAVLGALFVGIGAGLCVRADGAPSGDDALAMSLSKLFKCDIRIVYLISDLSVILLSASYIELKRLALSLLTVILSGQIVGIIQKIKGL